MKMSQTHFSRKPVDAATGFDLRGVSAVEVIPDIDAGTKVGIRELNAIRLPWNDTLDHFLVKRRTSLTPEGACPGNTPDFVSVCAQAEAVFNALLGARQSNLVAAEEAVLAMEYGFSFMQPMSGMFESGEEGGGGGVGPFECGIEFLTAFARIYDLTKWTTEGESSSDLMDRLDALLPKFELALTYLHFTEGVDQFDWNFGFENTYYTAMGYFLWRSASVLLNDTFWSDSAEADIWPFMDQNREENSGMYRVFFARDSYFQSWFVQYLTLCVLNFEEDAKTPIILKHLKNAYAFLLGFINGVTGEINIEGNTKSGEEFEFTAEGFPKLVLYDWLSVALWESSSLFSSSFGTAVAVRTTRYYLGREYFHGYRSNDVTPTVTITAIDGEAYETDSETPELLQATANGDTLSGSTDDQYESGALTGITIAHASNHTIDRSRWTTASKDVVFNGQTYYEPRNLRCYGEDRARHHLVVSKQTVPHRVELMDATGVFVASHDAPVTVEYIAGQWDVVLSPTMHAVVSFKSVPVTVSNTLVIRGFLPGMHTLSLRDHILQWFPDLDFSFSTYYRLVGTADYPEFYNSGTHSTIEVRGTPNGSPISGTNYQVLATIELARIGTSPKPNRVYLRRDVII